MKYIQKAPAKINLAIDVLSKRPDGFHDVKMIMQSVALYDVISLKPVHGGRITVTSNSKNIPTDGKNIVYKTAEYIRHKYNVKSGVEIHIEKNIPISAGLAGGSTDAAAVLKLLDKAWNLKLTKTEMLEAAKKLGSDVPFCITGGTALAEGLGEKLTNLKSMPECYILLAKPDMDISTKEVYEGIDLEEITRRPDIDAIIEAINEGNLNKIGDNLWNVLEYVTIKKCPLIKDIKEKLMEYGALGSVMSGSGPTVFGLFKDQSQAYMAYEHIKQMVNEIFVVKPLPSDCNM
ncbi:4-(cytidine 5'-diphospho)-2-C-methyl-D-erythritol kinase [Lutispora thermophila]|uniref:4-diphosphocytidyl-2-C-methyl-D-erythritol kinase n=1 Tax=Lutispora thermophila DSM 19022 TaxID=1122184 RepID=A0A1M6BTP8_9FIRM|nr:4-(cytidine 5'-diphospho)-2-C-methyl-D-erythritol kinase [Lutispora thermophila]SHI52109.1 4-diphosphocytidyl-2-C-methyl-D-erythritol kinase [Lutispora thermophila DSM 19022]